MNSKIVLKIKMKQGIREDREDREDRENRENRDDRDS
jgi:hypothetical protein